MKSNYLIFVFFVFTATLFSQSKAKEKLTTKVIYSDNFDSDLSNWNVEFEKPETSSVKIIDGKLDVSTSIGATIWFKTQLSGNIMITYDVKVIEEGGAFDRVSDLNAFWMATDPLNSVIKRDGKFASYDNLNLYYAGVGGHYNKFTRFRKYNGIADKTILKEYTDREHLLIGNTTYSVKIIVNKGRVHYFLNEELYWDFQDEKPYKEGFFGFRTSKSHQQFDNFKVFRIE
jgi:rhamnogalacturonan endolyase